MLIPLFVVASNQEGRLRTLWKQTGWRADGGLDAIDALEMLQLVLPLQLV